MEVDKPLSMDERADMESAELGSIKPNPCNSCAYRWPAGGRCDAFPAGIPWQIECGRVPHNKPLPELGQTNRIVYKLKGTAKDATDEMR